MQQKCHSNEIEIETVKQKIFCVTKKIHMQIMPD